MGNPKYLTHIKHLKCRSNELSQKLKLVKQIIPYTGIHQIDQYIPKIVVSLLKLWQSKKFLIKIIFFYKQMQKLHKHLKMETNWMRWHQTMLLKLSIFSCCINIAANQHWQHFYIYFFFIFPAKYIKNKLDASLECWSSNDCYLL